MNKGSTTKLLLNKETLRNLQDCELRHVAGGEQTQMKLLTLGCSLLARASVAECPDPITTPPPWDAATD